MAVLTIHQFCWEITGPTCILTFRSPHVFVLICSIATWWDGVGYTMGTWMVGRSPATDSDLSPNVFFFFHSPIFWFETHTKENYDRVMMNRHSLMNFWWKGNSSLHLSQYLPFLIGSLGVTDWAAPLHLQPSKRGLNHIESNHQGPKIQKMVHWKLIKVLEATVGFTRWGCVRDGRSHYRPTS